jgi:glycosyltransferase involved in cell wall biosynthesis
VTGAQPDKQFEFSPRHKLRLAYFVTHPIQYQVPLLRRIAEEQDIDLKVFFSTDVSVRGHVDQEFGVRVQWDIPLLDGYQHEFLPVVLDLRNGHSLGFLRPLNSQIRKKLLEGRFDAVWVHGYNYSTNLQAIWAAHSMKIPVLLRAESTLHDRPRSGVTLALKNIFFKMLKPRISAVLSIGDDNSLYWRRYFGERFPIFQVCYAVDNKFFQRECAIASTSREEFRASLGLEPGRPVILFAAKLIPRKRCGDLLDAYLRISSDSAIGAAPYLLIVGEGEERAELEKQAKAAKTGDVHFLGFRNQSELPRFYDLCDVFVLASVDEPWGLAINEVMNAGRAVIVTDQVGCQRNLVQNGVNGYVVRARDVSNLADGLRAVLANEPTCRAMGTESLRIIKDFSFEQNVTGIRLALEALVPGFSAT